MTGTESPRLVADLERCKRYLSECLTYTGDDWLGALWGVGDWSAEIDLIEKEMRVGDYQEFLDNKSHSRGGAGFAPLWIPEFLFDFQAALVDWSLRMGRCAIFADCGLGKTPMQLVWAQNVVEKTNKPVLILTPLAVAQQTVGEGKKFGIEVDRCVGGRITRPHIAVTNYEKLHHFDASDFAGVVCDESSCLKAFNGVRRSEVTAFMRKMPYRLLCTATAAPNDFTELGTSAEALGEMGLMDMLSRFFINDQNSSMVQSGRGRWKKEYGQKWRFKGHAEKAFWRWVCSWARACRKPSDLGFDDEGFNLPDLTEREHIVEARTLGDGMLFALPATNLQEEREERRRTIQERCERAASLVADTKTSAVVWCHLNDEGKLLSRLIEDAVEISGSNSDDEKESAYERFSSGDTRVLVIKPKIGAWGLNWQHCSHVVTFASHSYEQYYQAVRRCWRFGQELPVTVDIIASEGEVGVKANLKRKSEQADQMFSELVLHMNDALGIQRKETKVNGMEMPKWL